MLVRADLDLQLALAPGVGLEREPQLRDLADLAFGLAEPSQALTDAVEGRADALGDALDEVDVIRVPGRGRQVEPVKRSAAAEREPLREELVREDIEKGTRDDEVLLDIIVGRLARLTPPGDDVRAGKHQSAWTSGSGRTPQRGSGVPSCRPPGTSVTVLVDLGASHAMSTSVCGALTRSSR